MEQRRSRLKQYIGAAILGIAVAAIGFCATEVYRASTEYSPLEECIRRHNLSSKTPPEIRVRIYRNCRQQYR